MKPNQSYDTHTVGIQSDQLQINATAEMFELLSAKIYSHPIMAVVRELTINAIDEVIEANEENPEKYPIVPPIIHLPTQLEPWFEITDFGRGMDEEKVRDVYLTYGASSKLHTNKLTGYLGVGSKSPLAIDDQFTTTTRHEGIQRQYLIFKGSDRRPQVTLLEEKKTDEKSGTTIRISIKSHQFYDFAMAARKVARTLPQQPIWTGNKIESIPFNKLYENEYGFVYSDSYASDNYAVMGHVQYSISSEYVFLTKGTVLEFDMGELDFAASREHLEYTEKTKTSITNRLEQYNEQVKKDREIELNKMPSLFERFEVANKMNSFYRTHINEVNYKGRTFNIKNGFPSIKRKHIIVEWNGNISTTTIPTLHIDIYRFQNGRMRQVTNVSFASVLPYAIYVFRDTNNLPIKRIRTLLENNQNKFVVYITPKVKSLTKERCDRFYGHTTISLKSIEAKREARKTQPKTEIHNIYKMLAYPTGNNKSSGFKRYDLKDVKKDNYYVKLSRWSVVNVDNYSIMQTLRWIHRNQLPIEIYAIRGDLTDELKDILKPYSVLHDRIYNNSSAYTRRVNHAAFIQSNKIFKNKKVLELMSDPLLHANNIVDELERRGMFNDHIFNAHVGENRIYESFLHNQLHEFFRKYPLLKLASEEMQDEVIEFIKWKEGKNGN